MVGWGKTDVFAFSNPQPPTHNPQLFGGRILLDVLQNPLVDQFAEAVEVDFGEELEVVAADDFLVADGAAGRPQP